MASTAINQGVQRFRKKPIEVLAMPWDGIKAERLRVWTEVNGTPQFVVLAAVQPNDHNKAIRFRLDLLLASGYSAAVFDTSHSAWLGVHIGDWIIQGLQQEFYPCAAGDFDTIYEPVTP